MINYRLRNPNIVFIEGVQVLVINSEVAFDGNAYVCIDFFEKEFKSDNGMCFFRMNFRF